MDSAGRCAQLLMAARECSDRGLIHGAKWAAEQAHALEKSIQDGDALFMEPQQVDSDFQREIVVYTLGKSYFDAKEFDRAALVLRPCRSRKSIFLREYATYLAGERRKEDELVEVFGPDKTKLVNKSLTQLMASLSEYKKQNLLDGFGFYLFGIVLKELGLAREAMDAFVAGVTLYPLHWGAWQELATICADSGHVVPEAALPEHWMRDYFDAWLALELQQNDEAMARYESLAVGAVPTRVLISQGSTPNNLYAIAHMALACYNMREFDRAEELFKQLYQSDPLCLEHTDVYSNILFVKEQRPELSHLAHKVSSIDPYRVETCCVIGNYYSLCGQHGKAVVYFHRALRLNRRYLAAWTLMGHEYIELKNTPAAIAAYRRAVDINPRDYRAWYGLGQAYELLGMSAFALYYYRQAQRLRAYDGRMWSALALVYMRLNKFVEAVKCFERVHALNPADSTALHELATLHRTEAMPVFDMDKAVYYSTLLADSGEQSEHVLQAAVFLGEFHKKNGNLPAAEKYARFLMDFGGAEKEKGKMLLKDISEQRQPEMQSPS